MKRHTLSLGAFDEDPNGIWVTHKDALEYAEQRVRALKAQLKLARTRGADEEKVYTAALREAANAAISAAWELDDPHSSLVCQLCNKKIEACECEIDQLRAALAGDEKEDSDE